MISRVNIWVKKRRKKLLKEYGGKCFNKYCRKDNDLEFAHIKETGLKGSGRGRKERLYDVINNPNSYILLCKECHFRYDEGENLKLRKYVD